MKNGGSFHSYVKLPEGIIFYIFWVGFLQVHWVDDFLMAGAWTYGILQGLGGDGKHYMIYMYQTWQSNMATWRKFLPNSWWFSGEMPYTFADFHGVFQAHNLELWEEKSVRRSKWLCWRTRPPRASVASIGIYRNLSHHCFISKSENVLHYAVGPSWLQGLFWPPLPFPPFLPQVGGMGRRLEDVTHELQDGCPMVTFWSLMRKNLRR